MKPPVAPKRDAQTGPPAALSRLVILKNRPDFVATSRGRRASAPGLNLQARKSGGDTVTVGFTATKKVGNAVARNRAKRRLRALAADVLPGAGRAGWTYVLVARPQATATRAWEDLQRDLLDALEKVHS